MFGVVRGFGVVEIEIWFPLGGGDGGIEGQSHGEGVVGFSEKNAVTLATYFNG